MPTPNKRGPIVPKTQEWQERTQLVDVPTGLDSKLSTTTFKTSPENGVSGSETIFYGEAGGCPNLLQTVGYVRPGVEKGKEEQV